MVLRRTRANARAVADLILLRHGESQWNLENRFAGWADVPLSTRGEAEARVAGERLRGRPIDRLFTSVLTRAIETARLALEIAGVGSLPTVRAAELNERMYGDVEGLTKSEVARRFGTEQVKLWRHGYDVRPPGGESLSETAERVLTYWTSHIVVHLRAGENVLVVAHAGSLRPLIMHLEQLPPALVLDLNIPTGVPLRYEMTAAGIAGARRYL